MTPDIYTQRRKKLQQKLYILTAHTAVQSRADASFPFVQETAFFYLTGIDEPNWQLIIDTEKDTSYLVAPAIDSTHQLFDGGLLPEDALRSSGADKIFTLEDGKKFVEQLPQRFDTVYALGEHPETPYFDFVVNPAQSALWKSLEKHFTSVQDCRKEINKMRAIKSVEEIEHIKRAVAISIQGFRQVKNTLPVTKYEYEIEATLNDVFRRSGSGGHAYAPIVAGGNHACTLHYDKNSDQLPKNGFVLIDAATQVEGYAADITRTYAIGAPSKREVAIHNEVAKAHREIIDIIKPGLTFKDYSNEVDRIMKRALENVQLLNTPEDYRRYFPHSISHGLGIDVHDSFGGYESLQPGMVLTVEPGIYVPEEGIGVRLEDDILVTNDGNENLSSALALSL